MLDKGGIKASVIESGISQLASQPAVYFVSETTHKSLSLEIPVKQMQVSTVRQGFVFTITFRALPSQWDALVPEFELLANGFRFTGVLLESTHVLKDSDMGSLEEAPSGGHAREKERFERTVPVFWSCVILSIISIGLMLKTTPIKVSSNDDLRALRRQKRKGWIAVNFLTMLFLAYCTSLNGFPQGDPITTIIPSLAGYSTVGLIIALPIVWICYAPMRAKAPRGL
jgi:hypothetical protein